jgi:hypothetical protein
MSSSGGRSAPSLSSPFVLTHIPATILLCGMLLLELGDCRFKAGLQRLLDQPNLLRHRPPPAALHRGDHLLEESEMITGPWEFLIAGLLLLAVGGLLIRSGRSTRLKDVSGNVIIGDVKGSANQTYTAPSHAAPAKASGIGGKEIIGWLIAVPGGLLAAFNLWKALAGG